MNKVYVTLLIIVPIAMFFSGFLVARQLRALQNVPLISMMFVQRKWLTSAIIGIFISGILSLSTFLGSGFSAWYIIAFFIICLIASASYYLGITFGWGHSISSSGDIAPVDRTQIDALPDNVIVDDTLNRVKVTINTQRRWGWFVISLLQLMCFAHHEVGQKGVEIN